MPVSLYKYAFVYKYALCISMHTEEGARPLLMTKGTFLMKCFTFSHQNDKDENIAYCPTLVKASAGPMTNTSVKGNSR